MEMENDTALFIFLRYYDQGKYFYEIQAINLMCAQSYSSKICSRTQICWTLIIYICIRNSKFHNLCLSCMAWLMILNLDLFGKD